MSNIIFYQLRWKVIVNVNRFQSRTTGGHLSTPCACTFFSDALLLFDYYLVTLAIFFPGRVINGFCYTVRFVKEFPEMAKPTYEL